VQIIAYIGFTRGDYRPPGEADACYSLPSRVRTRRYPQNLCDSITGKCLLCVQPQKVPVLHLRSRLCRTSPFSSCTASSVLSGGPDARPLVVHEPPRSPACSNKQSYCQKRYKKGFIVKAMNPIVPALIRKPPLARVGRLGVRACHASLKGIPALARSGYHPQARPQARTRRWCIRSPSGVWSPRPFSKPRRRSASRWPSPLP